MASPATPGMQPQWMHCDLLAYTILEEVSAQISSNCRTLGDRLQSACRLALQQLPEDNAASAGACSEFLSTFASFSTALMAVAGDLEIIVTQPLQRTIAVLVEESTGRAKHLQQVRKRFADLQDKYAKTRQKTVDAKSKLANGGDKRWWRKPEKAAADQHAAVCDLACCEEELVASEASLRKLEDESRERLEQLELEQKATLQRVLQQGRCSLRRLLRVADEVPPMEEFQGVMPGVDFSASCLKEVVEARSPGGPSQPDRDMDAGMDSMPDRFARYLPGADFDGDRDKDIEVNAAARAAGWSPDSTSSRSRRSMKQGALIFESDISLQVLAKPAFRPGSRAMAHEASKLSEDERGSSVLEECRQTAPNGCSSEEEADSAPSHGDTVPATNIELQLSPLVAEQPQKSFERYMKRVPDNLAAAAETSWDKIQACAAEQPLGSIVGKLELFWIHQPGQVPEADTVDGLVCFQFVQGHATHYARIVHLSVASPQVLQSAVLHVKRLIFATLPVHSLRATVLAAEDDDRRICIDPQVERAYHQCGFRWFQLTQKLRRKKAAFLRYRKCRSLRFMVLHLPRTDADSPAPRDLVGTKAPLLLRSESTQNSPMPEDSADELSFSAW
ncbi:unnamed protein product [Effrenium voratum]|uniref:Uncharacterized protein n=1 Tax=Effrenium voratum TaxID=2562239 RepID=A0AA36IAU2_9DINO|nr:unnamed protein product [Effrenium voratum]CAJ1431150.1 unnamed protein product [Effrenium voratum]|mmetsp:Transcript_15428/g.36414  ORF Transcript_15428/g.36414 Transcript_15428/m.36414 type:complete len:618 (+) Transcript_15428:56-1909(+)